MQPFFILCVVGGVAFSLLVVLLATTRAPAQPPPSSPQAATAAVAVVAQKIETDHESRQFVNQGKTNLPHERATMLQRKADLRNRADALYQQQEVVPMLKADIQQLQIKIGKSTESTVAAEAAEAATVTRLAEAYGKLDPDSVATLLAKMDAERAAAILRLLGERQAGAILAAAVVTGSNGVKHATTWSDNIRRSAQGTRQ
jgi:flagellar motility protein MotE (MotC chaperone)